VRSVARRTRDIDEIGRKTIAIRIQIMRIAVAVAGAGDGVLTPATSAGGIGAEAVIRAVPGRGGAERGEDARTNTRTTAQRVGRCRAVETDVAA